MVYGCRSTINLEIVRNNFVYNLPSPVSEASAGEGSGVRWISHLAVEEYGPNGHLLPKTPRLFPDPVHKPISGC
jgi:hypothetical protein